MSIQILNILFIIYNILTLASSSIMTYVMGVSIPHFATLNFLFVLFLLFNISSLFFIQAVTKKQLTARLKLKIERFIYATIMLAASWSTVISTLNQSTYKHLLLYTFTIVFCAAFFILHARMFTFVVLLTSLALMVTILLTDLSVIKIVSMILYIVTLDAMAIVLSQITYQTSKRSYEANEKLRQQYEINETLTKKLEYEASYDLLTQMYNRRGFHHYMERLKEISSKKTAITWVIIDIDYFKQYNDYYGHAKGDTVLKSVSSAIVKVSDECGLIPARWGGEEFIAVGQIGDEQEVHHFGQRVMEEVTSLNIPHVQSEIADCVTVSIGSAKVYCDEAFDMAISFELADQALYEAKQMGRNRHIHRDACKQQMTK